MNNVLLEHLHAVRKLELDKYTCEEAKKRLKDENHNAMSLIIHTDNQKFDEFKPMFNFRKKELPGDLKRPPYRESLPQSTILTPKPKPVILKICLWGYAICAVIIAVIIGLTTDAPIVGGLVAGAVLSLLPVQFIVIFAAIITYIRRVKWEEANRALLEAEADAIYEKKQKEYQKALKKFEDEEKARYDSEFEQFNQKTKEYEERLAEFDAKREIKSQLCRKRLESNRERIAELDRTLAVIEEGLEEIYSANIVFAKYRSLIPISMFCEYLETGRCQQLEGTNGAYNKYEDELIGNTIIGKLDEIHTSLENIKQNQFLLYSGIKKVESSIYSLSETVSRTAGQLNANMESLSGNLELGLDSISDRVREQNALTAFNAQYLADRTDALATIGEEQLRLMRNMQNSTWN